MIFRSRTTKALLNVTEQNACSRSLFSSTSLMRTSVMTTAILLLLCCDAVGRRPTVDSLDATADHEHADSRIGRQPGPELAGDSGRIPAIATKGKQRRTAA